MNRAIVITAILIATCACERVEPLGDAGASLRAAVTTHSDPGFPDGRTLHVYKIAPLSGVSVQGMSIGGGFQVFNGVLSGQWEPESSGDMLGVALPVQAGERLERVDASIYGNTGVIVEMKVLYNDDAFHVGQELGRQVSVAHNTLQVLEVVQPRLGDNPEEVSTNMRDYWLQFRATRLSFAEGDLLVGPIVLVTSTPDPGSHTGNCSVSPRLCVDDTSCSGLCPHCVNSLCAP